MRILLASADEEIFHSLPLALVQHGFSGDHTLSAEEGVQMLGLYDYDAAILDACADGVGSLSTLRKARGARIVTPCIVLVDALASVASLVEALDAGADDCLAKPLELVELVARIRSLVRRSRGLAQQVISVGDLTIDIGERTVRVMGARVPLSAKEYQVVELLALRKGVTLTKEMFLNHLYGGRDEPEIKIVDVLICKIRGKLSAASSGRNYIETVWGRGFALREPENCGSLQKNSRREAAIKGAA